MKFERHFFIAVDVFTLAFLTEFVFCDRVQKPATLCWNHFHSDPRGRVIGGKYV